MARARNRTGTLTRRPRTAAPRLRARNRVLKNGLRVVAVEMPHVHACSLVAYVRAGSRYETAKTNGVSHFLEHMFFRGTDRFPSTYELAHHIESLGATFNATTTREMAYFYTEIAPRHLEAGVETLGEMFGSPLFPDIGIEREVVLEEMNEDYNEDGLLIDPDSVAKGKLWPGHPLGFPIIGIGKNVKRFKVEDLRAHHERLYTARNMVLCAAGGVSVELFDVSGAMTLEGLLGSHKPFLPEVHAVRPHDGQKACAAHLLQVLARSELVETHANCAKVQDPYSMRCIAGCMPRWRRFRRSPNSQARSVTASRAGVH